MKIFKVSITGFNYYYNANGLNSLMNLVKDDLGKHAVSGISDVAVVGTLNKCEQVEHLKKILLDLLLSEDPKKWLEKMRPSISNIVSKE
jgi:hypothetical protein